MTTINKLPYNQTLVCGCNIDVHIEVVAGLPFVVSSYDKCLEHVNAHLEVVVRE